jgi:hypothetical protein
MSSVLLHILTVLFLAILKIICLLIAIAYFTLAERKIMAAVQRRVGPNVVGPFGLLQPLADGLKLAGKELAIPAQASSRIFMTVAITVLLFALSGWSAIPFGLFDHSEFMNTTTVAKILVLTEPQLFEQEEPFSDILAEILAIAEPQLFAQGGPYRTCPVDLCVGGEDEDVCLDCDGDSDSDGPREGGLTVEEHAWVVRETMRFMEETRLPNMTDAEFQQWFIMILRVNELLIYRVFANKNQPDSTPEFDM